MDRPDELVAASAAELGGENTTSDRLERDRLVSAAVASTGEDDFGEDGWQVPLTWAS